LNTSEVDLVFAAQQLEIIEVLQEGDEVAKAQRETLERQRKELDGNQKSDEALINSLREEIEVLRLAGKELAIYEELNRLSTDATNEQRQVVEWLTAQLFDEQKAIEVLEEIGKDSFKQLENTIHDFGGNARDAIKDFVTGADTDIKRLAKSIIDTFLEIAAQQTIISPMESGFRSIISGLLGGLVGVGFGGLEGAVGNV